MNLPTGDWGAQLHWSLDDPAVCQALSRHAATMAGLRVVYDNDGLWDWGDPRGDGPPLLRRMVDQYVEVGARGLVWGCGNNLAWSYTPRVQEAWCDRVPCEDAHLAHLADRQRQWLACGTSPLDVILERARMHRLPVLAGFRLNRFFTQFGLESWFTDNPQVVLSAASCPLHPTQQSANLALLEVRRHFIEGSLDVVARYPVDGLHLEFMRAIPFFERGEPDKREQMLTFLRELRAGLDRLGAARGQRLELSIWSGTEANYRVLRRGLFPPEFMALEFHGIDLQAWIEEGLVDRLMLSCWSGGSGRRGEPVELTSWTRLARGTGIRILGEVDNATEMSEPEQLRQAGEVIRRINALSDGVYLFNTPPASLAFLLERANQAQ
ncbi:MAG: hypothetical protein WDA75_00165 [Candidatus Latescibacterota bacterium]